MNTNITNDIVSIVIGIVGLIIGILPLMTKKSKYINRAFSEYNFTYCTLFSKKARLLWKLNWACLSLVSLVMYVNIIRYRCFDVRVFSETSICDFIIILSIIYLSITVKIVFHNKFAYKEITEKLFTSHFDTYKSLNIVVLLESQVLIVVLLVSFIFQIIEIRIALIIVIAVCSSCFCYFSIIEDICEILFLQKVKKISIVMTNGTVYEDIDECVDLGNILRIVNTEHTVINYLSKEAVSSITKELENEQNVDLYRKEGGGENHQQENELCKKKSGSEIINLNNNE